MKILLRLFGPSLALTLLCGSSAAQCANAVLILRGVVTSDLADAGDNPSFSLQVRAGRFFRATEVRSGEFRIELSFSTQKRYSPLTGHNCSYWPKFVELTLSRDGEAFIHQTLSAKTDFRMQDPLTFVVKHDLILKASVGVLRENSK